MTWRGLVSVGLLLIACLSVGSVQAKAERRMALVIGNSQYKISPLTNPGNDAALMAEALSAVGFEVTHLTDVNYRNFQRAVVQFSRALNAAGEDTVGMVYYAGHAVQADGENYLIPVDAEIQDELDLRIQTVDTAMLMAGLERAGNRLNLVVLDACRNNPFKSSSRSGSRGLAKIEAPNGTLLAYSTAPGEVASDGTGQNSPYTAAFVKAMQIPGLPVEQVMKQVRIEVMERTGDQQVPWESSSLTGDFYFIAPQLNVEVTVQPPPPAPVDNNAAEMEFWRSIATSDDPALFQQYLNAYPQGLFNGIAQQRITSLQSTQQTHAAKAAWEAVKDSSDPAMLQSVINSYPGSVYAELAQVKIQSLTQTASLPPQGSQSPLDGRWEVTWKVLPGTAHYSKYSFCAYDEVGSKVIDIVGGAFRTSITSNKSRSGVLEGKIEPGNSVGFYGRGVDWNNARLFGSLAIKNGRISGILENLNGPHCQAEITMVRVAQ